MLKAIQLTEQRFMAADRFLAEHIDAWLSEPVAGKALKSAELVLASVCVAGAAIIYNEFHNEISDGLQGAGDQVQRVAQVAAQRLGLVKMEME